MKQSVLADSRWVGLLNTTLSHPKVRLCANACIYKEEVHSKAYVCPKLYQQVKLNVLLAKHYLDMFLEINQ